MMDIRSESLSISLLENQDSKEKVKAESEEAAGVAEVRGAQRTDQLYAASWTLFERAQVIKILLEQEINWQEVSSLGVEEIDLILTAILDLERLRLLLQRLNQDQIVAMLTAIFKKCYTGDRFKMIIEEVRRLENNPDNQKITLNSIKSHSNMSRAA